MSRLSIPVHAPEGYRAVQALEATVREALDPVLVDLVFLRVSQMNGCAYCIDLHSGGLEALGLPWRVINAVQAWRESAWFSPRERAALRIAEELTAPGADPETAPDRLGIADPSWAEAREHLSDAEVANVVLAAGTMALLNRIGVASRLRPGGPTPERDGVARESLAG
ncbi:carboxymuconolactone decarboxylase family protein [Leucobacter sp. M11]|uniref:carboxymuconolactone decarboxylase family protein n=1 Tax=Leucobacter sp. M11 TaxID=2993565 RepID=UPI002D7F590D|nr:carboxymuconolactone decarboxylase family protein [Leucobacter sp. M11]MEB4615603.1 carboxymuconolactone decarboxylase family protein [Leucobacter sp. M11]